MSYDELLMWLRSGRTGPDQSWEELCGKAASAIERLQAELAEAVANEREACAKVADGFRDKWGHAGGFGGHSAGARIIAAAIRERTD